MNQKSATHAVSEEPIYKILRMGEIGERPICDLNDLFNSERSYKRNFMLRIALGYGIGYNNQAISW